MRIVETYVLCVGRALVRERGVGMATHACNATPARHVPILERRKSLDRHAASVQAAAVDATKRVQDAPLGITDCNNRLFNTRSDDTERRTNNTKCINVTALTGYSSVGRR